MRGWLRLCGSLEDNVPQREKIVGFDSGWAIFMLANDGRRAWRRNHLGCEGREERDGGKGRRDCK